MCLSSLEVRVIINIPGFDKLPVAVSQNEAGLLPRRMKTDDVTAPNSRGQSVSIPPRLQQRNAGFKAAEQEEDGREKTQRRRKYSCTHFCCVPKVSARRFHAYSIDR